MTKTKVKTRAQRNARIGEELRHYLWKQGMTAEQFSEETGLLIRDVEAALYDIEHPGFYRLLPKVRKDILEAIGFKETEPYGTLVKTRRGV